MRTYVRVGSLWVRIPRLLMLWLARRQLVRQWNAARDVVAQARASIDVMPYTSLRSRWQFRVVAKTR